MNRFLAVLKDPKVLGTLLFLLLLFLTWLAGSVVGLTPLQRTYFIAAVSVITLIIGLIVIVIQRARETAPAAAAEEDGPASERRTDIEGLRTQLQRAMQEMRGRDLPWYLVLGPLGSGKTLLLRHSGLEFPLVGIRDVGSHQNCKWWFTNEAVLLDTSGHYITDNERKEEWLAFLDLLRKARWERPIEGALVTESVEDLVKLSEEEIEAHAKKIRNRIDEMIQRLDVLFPVYVVFTKCDLLQGFPEFFSQFGADEVMQAWGCTLPRDLEEDPEVVFETEFRQLCRPLNAFRLSQLGREKELEAKYKVYTFPLQFAALQDRLSHFVSVLFRPNPYQTRPIFRGFYFTSAQQDGVPMDLVIGRLRRAFGFAQAPGRADFAEDKEPVGYFITDLFERIIFRDHVFTPLSTAQAPDEKRSQHLLAVVVTAVVCFLIVLFSLISYIGNDRLMTRLAQAAKEARNGVSPKERLDGLEALRKEIVDLDYSEHHWWHAFWLRWGLYKGSDLFPAARQAYYTRLQEDYIDSGIKSVESRLKQLKSPPEEEWFDYYNLLKTYLLLTSERARADSKFFPTQVARLANVSSERVLDGGIQDQILYYLSQSEDKEHPPLIAPLEANFPLVAQVRRYLNAAPDETRVFGRLINKCNDSADPFSLGRLLQSKPSGYLNGSHVIPGSYTKNGWDKCVARSIGDENTKVPADDWVLYDPNSARAITMERKQMTGLLQERYFREYANQWLKLLENVTVTRFSNVGDAVRGLENLASDSPVAQLLREVAANTRLEREPGNGSKGLVDSLEISFRPVNGLITGTGQNAPIGEYLGALLRMRDRLQGLANPSDPWGQVKSALLAILSNSPDNEFYVALLTINRIAPAGDRLQMAVRNILEPPVKSAAGSLFLEGQQQLNKLWHEQVYDTWQKTLDGKYPFNPSGPDAPLEDVKKFFHPTTGDLAKFYTNELKPFLIESPGSWRAKDWNGYRISFSKPFLESLSRAQTIRDGLFPDQANLQIPFTLKTREIENPKPNDPNDPLSGWTVTRTDLEIDGKPLPYFNGPAAAQKFSWPGTEKNYAQLQTTIGKRGTSASQALPPLRRDGVWGWFRLLDLAKKAEHGETPFVVDWTAQTRDGNRVADIRYELLVERSVNPFRSGFFANLKFPPDIASP